MPGDRNGRGRRARCTPAALVVVLVATAGALGCGSDDRTDDGAASGPTTVHDMSAMNMGDPNAVAAAEAGGDLVSGRFELLDTRPPGLDDVSGTADLARTGAGTTVTIELTGLAPDEDYLAHVHTGTCAEGDGHYRFDPDGPTTPPNEIHLAFAADAEGTGFMTAENDRTVGATARSVVVHPARFTDNWIVCADLG